MNNKIIEISDKAVKYLKAQDPPIRHLIENIGINTPNDFLYDYLKYESPKTGYYKSPIGILKIMTSNKGLEMIEFTEEIEDENKSESNLVNQVKSQLDEYFAGLRKTFDIPLVYNGTAFQKKVWHTLCTIPYGKTLNYGQIASIIGNKKASRAVGGANNRNKIAIIIPCHRVIGANAELTGYAGGLDKKRWLLEHEKYL